MRFRKLRIAWSVAWGVMAVLLCVFWVRSYRAADTVLWRYSEANGLRMQSCLGRVRVAVVPDKPREVWTTTATLVSDRVRRWEPRRYSIELVDGQPDPEAIDAGFVDSSVGVALPHWFVLLLCTLLAAASSVRRFSLRTMLLATTLSAVVLRAVVWAIK